MTTLHVVVMGVAGSGKSTAAQVISDEFGMEVAEGDDFHPRANIEKMSGGEALTDADRWPWLDALADWTAERRDAGRSTVLTCSALKRAYRDVLRRPDPATFFVHLRGDEQLLRRRLESRDHFMPASLLRSQLETLEELAPDERGAAVEATLALQELTDTVVALVAAERDR
jgi:carbohydrate kinase (thermoresistant glucokinase family)